MPNSRPASTFDVAAQPPMYAARLADSAAVDALRPPQAELQHRLALGGQQTRAALVAMSVWKLTMFSSAVSSSWPATSGPRDAHQRLVREDDRALGHGVDVARAASAGRGSRGTPGSNSGWPSLPVKRGQVGEVGRVEAEVLEVIDGRGQPAGDRVAAAERVACGRTGGTPPRGPACRLPSSRRPW